MAKTISPEEDAERQRLYDKGYNDTDIAIRRSVTPIAIRNWRKKKGLLSNYDAIKGKSDERKRKDRMFNKPAPMLLTLIKNNPGRPNNF